MTRQLTGSHPEGAVGDLAASATMAPRPTPGKMKTLLAWPTMRHVPLYSTGGQGLPVAITARPSVHAVISSGCASAQ